MTKKRSCEELKKKMDRSLTSPKTTPFSINDILTKNNTTILRRNSSGHLSPINKKSINEKCSDHLNHEPTDDLSFHLSDSMHFLKYSPSQQQLQQFENVTNIDQSIVLRRSTSTTASNYLCNNNNNKVHNSNDVKQKRNTHGNRDGHGHGNATDKTMKPLRFYNFPLMLERPLDMRRCADDDDSGKTIRHLVE